MQLNINTNHITQCRNTAKSIALSVLPLINKNSTVAIERSIARLCGVQGANGLGIPYDNILIDYLIANGLIHDGVLYFLSKQNKEFTPLEIAMAMEQNLFQPAVNNADYPYRKYIEQGLDKIKKQRAFRENNIIKRFSVYVS